MTSALRYPGGKTRACKKLDEILNLSIDWDKVDTIYSPFVLVCQVQQTGYL